MKIKEVSAGVKISKNYNSYQMNLVADLENGEGAEKVGEILIEKAIEVLNKKINNLKVTSGNSEENKFKGLEVGAAWFSKDSKDKLSVQYSKGGNWVDIEIKDLEKIQDGFKQKIGKDVFVFRRIPEEKRKNNKMPMFRIYKMESDN